MTHIFADEIEQRCIAENHEVVARAMSGPDLENGKELERIWKKIAAQADYTDSKLVNTFHVFVREILHIDPYAEDLLLNNTYWRMTFIRRCFDYGLTKALEMTRKNRAWAGKPKTCINVIQDTPEVAYDEVQYLDAGDNNEDDFRPWTTGGFTE